MQNDQEGRIAYEGIETFYASGLRGPETRADGQGGFISRGYYAWDGDDLIGPFSTRAKAWRAVDVEPTSWQFVVRNRKKERDE